MTTRREKSKKSKKQAIDLANIEIDVAKVLDTKLVADMVDLKDTEILGELEVDNAEVKASMKHGETMKVNVI